MDIVQIITTLFKSLFGLVNKKMQVPAVVSSEARAMPKRDDALYDRQAWENAFKFIKANYEAYYDGYIEWKGGTHKGTGQRYNNVLLAHEGGEYLEIFRTYKAGLYYLNGCDIITKERYIKEMQGDSFQTYCNVLASAFTVHYGAGDIQRYKDPRTGKYHEHSANDVFDNLKSGYYNTEELRWKIVDYKEGVSYASDGGLTLASWRNPRRGRSGHVAVVTGRGDINSMKTIEIFQAGLDYGYMPYKKGFGTAVALFFILVENDIEDNEVT